MEACKFCGHDGFVKNGFYAGKQRYRCKQCQRSMTSGDRRVKYSHDQKIKVLKMYLEGVGIRAIERLEGVSNPLIIQWIRNQSNIMGL